MDLILSYYDENEILVISQIAFPRISLARLPPLICDKSFDATWKVGKKEGGSEKYAIERKDKFFKDKTDGSIANSRNTRPRNCTSLTSRFRNFYRRLTRSRIRSVLSMPYCENKWNVYGD